MQLYADQHKHHDYCDIARKMKDEDGRNSCEHQQFSRESHLGDQSCVISYCLSSA